MSSTSSTPDDAARREKTRQHFTWQQRVAERTDLSPTVRLAAWALARRRNVMSGRCDPSYADIAKGMGHMTERSAMRAVAALERAGLIIIERRVGRGRRNRLIFVMPEKVTQPCQGFAVEKGDKPGAGRPPHVARKGDKPAAEKVTELCHPNMKRASTKPSEHGEKESARAREAPDISSWRCRAAEMEEGRKPAADRPGGNAGRDARADHPEAIEGEIIAPVAGGFQDLLAVYARGWPEDHALAGRRYADACAEVGHAVIMEGARRWAEVYLADNGGLQFMPPLDHWLAQRLWQEEPQRRWKARAEKAGSNGVRRYGGKPDLARIAIAQGIAIREGRSL